MEKVLIAYYSRRGGNYVDGKVKSLSIGNTERAAHILQRLTGGDLFQIEQLVPYPEDYYKCIDKARQDLIRGVRPELKKLPNHLDRYKTVYLGYPNYWGTMPVAVFSFLERLDFTGKRLKPFCTYSDSGMGWSRLCRHRQILVYSPLQNRECFLPAVQSQTRWKENLMRLPTGWI